MPTAYQHYDSKFNHDFIIDPIYSVRNCLFSQDKLLA